MPFIPYNSAGGLTTQAGTGNHEHTYQQMGTRNASGTDFVGGNGSNNNSASTTGTGAHTHTVVGDTANESSHTHTFTTTSMNGNVAQTDHLPPYIAFGKFIYLGL